MLTFLKNLDIESIFECIESLFFGLVVLVVLVASATPFILSVIYNLYVYGI